MIEGYADGQRGASREEERMSHTLGFVSRESPLLSFPSWELALCNLPGQAGRQRAASGAFSLRSLI